MTTAPSSTLSYDALPTFSFGDNPALADELLALVLEGKKTATCGTEVEYLAAGDPIPEPGNRFVVLDGKGQRACVIETTSIERKRFLEVEADFAYEEGEGDRSLNYWRDAHRTFFERQPYDWSEDTLLICERFKLVHIFEPGTTDQ